MSTLYYPKDKPELKKIFSPDDAKRCKVDPVFFITNYCWTFDPRPQAPEHHLRFVLYPFQEAYVLWLVDAITTGKDGLTEKSRDMGVTWLHMAVYLWCWFYVDGFQALLGSRKEDLVDNAMTDSLFGKLDYMIERLPFQPKGYIRDKHRNYMRLIHPVNGNAIKGESANAEFSRQGRYSVVYMDEFAFWDKPESAWTASGEATQCRMAVTTPPKQRNFVTSLRHLADQKQIDVMLQSLHWRLHPLKDEAWYERQKQRKLPEELAQEIDINWEGSITGRVYTEVEHIRVGNFPYRPDWPLYVAHDPGHKPDPYALGWFQVNPETGRVRLVESFEAVNKIVEWFFPLFGTPLDSSLSYTASEITFIDRVKDWRKGTHFGDVAGRQGNVVSGTSAYDKWRDIEVYVNSNTKANDIESRKTETKRLLMHMDINDTPNNRYWLECMKNARYPDVSDNSQRITPNVKPIHDWTSHQRTMTEYFAVNFTLDIKEYEPVGQTFNKAFAMIQKSTHRSDVLGNEV